eukprot:m.57827 g.57827  ORF g.57827 m.57827 type:complete len:270 (+) comp7104_c0_seq2:37-846(+)
MSIEAALKALRIDDQQCSHIAVSEGLAAAELAPLVDEIARRPLIRRVDFSLNELCDDDEETLELLEDLLLNTMGLEELLLDDNELGDRAAVAIAEGLPHAGCLLHISLVGNAISDTGAAVLAAALARPDVACREIDVGANACAQTILQRHRAVESGRGGHTALSIEDEGSGATLHFDWETVHAARNDDTDMVELILRLVCHDSSGWPELCELHGTTLIPLPLSAGKKLQWLRLAVSDPTEAWLEVRVGGRRAGPRFKPAQSLAPQSKEN